MGKSYDISGVWGRATVALVCGEELRYLVFGKSYDFSGVWGRATISLLCGQRATISGGVWEEVRYLWCVGKSYDNSGVWVRATVSLVSG